jgi:hypothetical protein
VAIGLSQPGEAEAPTAITDVQKEMLTSLHRTPLCGDVNVFRGVPLEGALKRTVRDELTSEF